MSESLANAVNELQAQISRLAPQRQSDAFANDLYEAAFYWYQLGSWFIQNETAVNYPERARGERELLSRLQSRVGTSTEVQPKYAPLLSAGERILEILAAVELPKNGHLGFLKIIHECFHFLTVDFNFVVTKEEPTKIRFSSDKVYLELACSSDPWLSCEFGPEPSGQRHFWIHDLLYLRGDQRYRIIPAKLILSETEVRNWFRFIAEVFEDGGRDVLSNKPGIFDNLMKAQSERDIEFIAALDELDRSRQ